MAIDIGILFILVIFAFHGYAKGFLSGLTSRITPVLGIWLGLRKCDAFATVLYPMFHNYTVSVVASFLIILVIIWFGLKLFHNLLMKLIDWGRCIDLDQFLGGFLGLAKATVVIWFMLVLSLTVFPPSVSLIERSKASVHLLAIGERVTGQIIADGKRPAKPGNSFKGLGLPLTMFQQFQKIPAPEE